MGVDMHEMVIAFKVQNNSVSAHVRSIDRPM